MLRSCDSIGPGGSRVIQVSVMRVDLGRRGFAVLEHLS